MWLAAIIAVVLLGVARGGFAGIGQLSTPLLALTVSPLEAVAILLPICLIQDALSVWTYRADWDARNLLITLPGIVVGIGLAWMVADHADGNAVRLIVGSLILMLVLIRWSTRNSMLGILLGVVSGFGGLLINAAGPPFMTYLIAQKLPKTTYVGTMIVFFALADILKVFPLFMLHQFTMSTLQTSAMLLPPAIAANFFGIWLMRRTSPNVFNRTARIFLITIAIMLIWQGIK